MDFSFTEEENKLIEEVRAFLRKEVTIELFDEVRELGPIYGGKEARKIFGKFGEKGWIAPNWSEEYGGLGASELVSYAIRDELSYILRAHMAFIGAHMAGPTILRFGNEEMKKEYLKPIAKGEIEFALGYTEPDAGSDLMNLSMRAEMQAEDKGEYFVVNGTKTFNTSCSIADYHWLAVRTDPDVPKHKGISIMIVDLKSPGITINPMVTMGGYCTNEVFYDDVEVPKKNLVGELNKGTYYLMTALDFERMFPPSVYRSLFEDVLAFTKVTYENGRPLSEDPLIRQKLAQMAIELEIARLLYYQLAYMLDKGTIPNYQSSMEKTFVAEMDQRLTNSCMEIMGLYSQLARGSKWASLGGNVERYYRMSVIESVYGGASELQRNIIAQKGLGLPKK